MRQEVQQRIAELKYTLENNADNNYGYKLYHARADAREWSIIQDKTTDLRAFDKALKKIKEFGSDAIRVEIWNNVNVDRKRSNIIKEEELKLEDGTLIPLIDDRVMQAEPIPSYPATVHKTTPMTHNELGSMLHEAVQGKENELTNYYGNQLAGLQMQSLKDKHENDIRFLEQKQEYALDKLNMQLSALTKERDELKKNLEESELTIAELSEQVEEGGSERNKVMTAGLGMLAGKALGFEQDKIMQLGSLLMGGELSPIDDDEPAELPANTPNTNTAQQARQTDLASIYQWMQQLPDEEFRKFAQLVMALNERGDLLDHFINYIEQLIARNSGHEHTNNTEE